MPKYGYIVRVCTRYNEARLRVANWLKKQNANCFFIFFFFFFILAYLFFFLLLLLTIKSYSVLVGPLFYFPPLCEGVALTHTHKKCLIDWAIFIDRWLICISFFLSFSFVFISPTFTADVVYNSRIRYECNIQLAITTGVCIGHVFLLLSNWKEEENGKRCFLFFSFSFYSSHIFLFFFFQKSFPPFMTRHLIEFHITFW